MSGVVGMGSQSEQANGREVWLRLDPEEGRISASRPVILPYQERVCRLIQKVPAP